MNQKDSIATKDEAQRLHPMTIHFVPGWRVRNILNDRTATVVQRPTHASMEAPAVPVVIDGNDHVSYWSNPEFLELIRA